MNALDDITANYVWKNVQSLPFPPKKIKFDTTDTDFIGSFNADTRWKITLDDEIIATNDDDVRCKSFPCIGVICTLSLLYFVWFPLE